MTGIISAYRSLHKNELSNFSAFDMLLPSVALASDLYVVLFLISKLISCIVRQQKTLKNWIASM